MFKQDNEDVFSIEDLFRDPVDHDEETTQEEIESEEPQKESTHAVSQRINEVRKQTESETEERIAKSLGYESYAEMLKANEQKEMRDAGLDSDELSSLIDSLVEKRLANDPRMKKLAEIEADEKSQFVINQLKEINSISEIKYKSVEELPEDTLKLWEKTGNLKQAYLATEGEKLLNKSKSINMRGSSSHLIGSNNGAIGSKTRLLTEDEKDMYRAVLGDYYNEDEISKKTRPID